MPASAAARVAEQEAKVASLIDPVLGAPRRREIEAVVARLEEQADMRVLTRLLVRRGIYTRTCDDKKGLEPGKFLRVASRCRSENRFVLRAFRDIMR